MDEIEGFCCQHVWGKDPDHEHPYMLGCHLLDTSVVMGVLWDHWVRPGLREILARDIAGGDHALARQRLMLLAGCHDLGKSNPFFQLQEGSRSSAPWRSDLAERFRASGLEPTKQSVRVYRIIRSATKSPLRRHEFVGMPRRRVWELPAHAGMNREDPASTHSA